VVSGTVVVGSGVVVVGSGVVVVVDVVIAGVVVVSDALVTFVIFSAIIINGAVVVRYCVVFGNRAQMLGAIS